MEESVEDPFVMSNLNFLNFVAIFLRKYQTENPVILFLYSDWNFLVKKLLELILKPTVVDACILAPNQFIGSHSICKNI